MKLTAIVCTYNPRSSVFRQCLQGIVNAHGRSPIHELIIVDNNSSEPVSAWVREILTDQIPFRVVVEEEQGLTPARLRGIRESTGDLIVFVDDDNFLQDDFFLEGIRIAESNGHIGAYSGQVVLEFEKEPESWTRQYWGLLVYREFKTDSWSNLPYLSETMPCGAGLYVRKSIARYYLDLHDSGKRQIKLDRSGSSLFSGGDNDLAACACDLGMGVGLFQALVIRHYIPKERTSLQYLIKLNKGIVASAVVFRAFRLGSPVEPGLKTKLANAIRFCFKDRISRAFFRSTLQGEKEGMEIVKNNLHG